MSKNIKNLDTNNTIGELFSLSPVKRKPVELSFTAPDLSSQGGLMLMNEYGQHHGFIAKLSDCVEDTCSQLLVQHPYYEIFRQRICQIAAGYKDADDSDFNTYGDRQGTLFNDYYGEYCYMPLFIFEGQSGKMVLPATGRFLHTPGIGKRWQGKVSKKTDSRYVFLEHLCIRKVRGNIPNV
jgi:hypothetical protein